MDVPLEFVGVWYVLAFPHLHVLVDAYEQQGHS